MKVANYIAPGQVDFRTDATRPAPAAGQVLVRVKQCGICGSDVHMFRNGTFAERIALPYPEGYRVPGHELAGVIAELGDGVEGWSVGDRVVAVPGQGGGMAEYLAVNVNPYQLVAVPDEVDFDEAATTEPMADSLQMVRIADVQPGENVVVFGVGIIGLGVIQALKAKGVKAGSIIAIDVVEARLKKAMEVGATAALDSRDENLFQRVAEAAGGTIQSSFQGEHANISVVIDTAGYSSHFGDSIPLQHALNFVIPNTSRIICFGGFGDPVTLDLVYLVRKQARIMGSYGFDPAELVEALDLMRTRAVDRRSLISHYVPLENALEAYKTQMAPDAVKVMIQIPEPG